MVQLVAHPIGDHEVAGSIPAGSATFFHRDLIMQYVLWFLTLSLILEGELLVSGERMCTLLVNGLVD